MKNIVLVIDLVDNKVNVHWMTIRNQRIRFIHTNTWYIEQQSDIDFDYYVTLPTTDMVELKFLVRVKNFNIKLLNDFVATYVLGQYSHTKHGWEMTIN